MKEWNLRRISVQMMGIIVARAAFMGMNPLAVAYFSAIYLERRGRFMALLAIILGTFTVLPAAQAVKYTLVLVVLTVITSLIEYNKKRLTVGLVGGLAGGITAAMTLAEGFLTRGDRYFILLALAEGVAIFAISFIFRRGLEPILHGIKGQAWDNEQIISIAVILAVAIYGLPDLGGLDVSLTLTAVLFSVLFIGYKYGAGYGAVAGVACGIVLALKNNQMSQIGMMCMLGIIAGTFRELGRFFTMAMYAVAVFILSEMYQNSQVDYSYLGALVSGAAVFLLLPGPLTGRINIGEDWDKEDIFVRQSIQSVAKGKLRDFSESFQNLSNTFNSIADKKAELNKSDKTKIFNELSETLCKDCTNCNLCWNSNFYNTYQGAYHIMETVEKNGTIALSEVPEDFAGRCIFLDKFLLETGRIMELAKVNLSWYNRMAESREAIAGQFNEVANIIKDFSTELYKTSETTDTIKKRMIYELKANHIIVKRIAIFDKRNGKQEIYMTARTERGRCITVKEAAGVVSGAFGKRMCPSEGCKNVMTKEFETFVFVEDANYKVFTGMARMTKEGGVISGDNFSFIYPDQGTIVMTLSDGMGTGETACEESESVVELLEQFIEAGFRKESAVKLINSILVLKSEEQSFSTIDMSVINLYTGICDFIKIGAAATFVKRNNWVEAVSSTTLPIGMLNQVDYDTVTRQLYDGDFIIMVTDGVVDCIPGDDKEKFLEEFLGDLKMNNPKEIADAVLNQALELNQWVSRDDMTVLAAGFWQK